MYLPNHINLLRYFIFGFLLMINSPVAGQLLPDTAEKESVKPGSEDELGRTTPRGTVQGFLSAVADRNYELASRYLNLEETPNLLQDKNMARVLQKLLMQQKMPQEIPHLIVLILLLMIAKNQ